MVFTVTIRNEILYLLTNFSFFSIFPMKYMLQVRLSDNANQNNSIRFHTPVRLATIKKKKKTTSSKH